MRTIHVPAKFHGVIKVDHVPDDVPEELVRDIALAVAKATCDPTDSPLDKIDISRYPLEEGLMTDLLFDDLANKAEISVGTWYFDVDEGTVAWLASLAEGLGLQEEDLDELTHDVASQEASNINNRGILHQIRYLVSHLGVEETKRQFMRLKDDQ